MKRRARRGAAAEGIHAWERALVFHWATVRSLFQRDLFSDSLLVSAAQAAEQPEDRRFSYGGRRDVAINAVCRDEVHVESGIRPGSGQAEVEHQLHPVVGCDRIGPESEIQQAIVEKRQRRVRIGKRPVKRASSRRLQCRCGNCRILRRGPRGPASRPANAEVGRSWAVLGIPSKYSR